MLFEKSRIRSKEKLEGLNELLNIKLHYFQNRETNALVIWCKNNYTYKYK